MSLSINDRNNRVLFVNTILRPGATQLTQGSTVIRLLSATPRSVSDTVFETQATQQTQGRAAQVSVIHKFEYVGAN
jgi:hypothetical protein